MKVLHLNNEKTWRGGERQTLFLARALADMGCPSIIACRPGRPLAHQARAENVPVVPLAGNPLAAAAAIVWFARHCDVIHCHTGRTHSLAALTSFLHRKPVIVTRRVAFPIRQSAFNRYKYRRAHKLVGISTFIARQLADWGVSAEKIAIVPSAVAPVDSPASGAVRAQLRAELHLPLRKKIVGNIGALTSEKDHVTLLQAAQKVFQEHPDVLFVVVGSGALHGFLLQKRRELQLDQVVVFLGQIPRAERLLPAFDVLAVSSRMEGLCSTILDAFAAGVPVAATACGGIPDLVRPGETGLLAPSGDAAALAAAISKLLGDDQLRRTVSSTALAFVNGKFSIAEMARQYQEIYTTVLGGC